MPIMLAFRKAKKPPLNDKVMVTYLQTLRSLALAV